MGFAFVYERIILILRVVCAVVFLFFSGWFNDESGTGPVPFA